MSAMSFVRQAFVTEKPHSSITDWVDILTANGIAEEAYDGIPELVDSINLQGATGTGEASRALRKKLKHGGPHQQYRALVVLKALVENCGEKFKSSFADGQLTDALRGIASDRTTDKRVQKKLRLVLISWHEQFQSDPSMRSVSELYLMCKEPRQQTADILIDPEAAARKAEKEEAKKRAKMEKEEARRKEEEERRKRKEMKNKPKRAPFDFQQEKPKVLASIVEASQASSNLVNAITLVNPEKESLQSNERVQECLAKTKQARKQIVRYIQLVDSEEVIGVLIETNDRIIAAMEMYDQLSNPNLASNKGVDSAADGLAATHISPESEVTKLQEKQKAAVQRAKNGSVREKSTSGVYADLQDLNFGPLGASSSNLPPPMRPTNLSDDEEQPEARGSLSDFSDYESSDENTHNAARSSYGRKNYVTVSDDSDDAPVGNRGTTSQSTSTGPGQTKHVEEDPFADPFAD
ncbi:hypothetical protein K435DRAFT_959671 [Dendrothele bispora CBS 962.96]|uniref:VHS domain-containing protein n=1 Tax=Dendrothele bispora (strain CBS 962.96) TaxID=1314807 RepID=A0A4S8MY13_DENBC|nr:hypothetical protein K435DRAFT_959671 [Dendrothele bispora CBS 962.96]